MKNLLFSLALVLIYDISAQEIGIHFNREGVYFDQYFDISHTQFADHVVSLYPTYEYIQGKVYGKSGSITTGRYNVEYGKTLKSKGALISENETYDDDIYDTDQSSGFSSIHHVALDTVEAVKIGADSFIVISNYKLGRSKRADKEAIIGLVWVSKYYELYEYRETSGSSTKYIKVKDSDKWNKVNYFRGDVAKDIFSRYANNDIFETKIADFNPEDIDDLIKSFKYYEYFLAGKKIYFDQGYQETNDISDSEAYARIEEVNDKNWKLTFYSKLGIKRSTGWYSDIFPFVPNGKVKKYYSDGTLMEEAIYDEGKLIGSRQRFYPNGKLQWEVQQLNNKENTRIYSKVCTQEGKTKSGTSWNLKAEDEINKRTIEYLFDKEKLKMAGFYDQDLKSFVHMVCESPAKVKMNKNLEYTDVMKDQGVSGFVIVKILADNQGKLIDYDIKNAPHKLLKECVIDVLESDNGIKIKPAKQNGRKVFSEFLYTFRFDIKATYKRRTYYYDHVWLHQQMWMHQQQIFRPQITVPAGF